MKFLLTNDDGISAAGLASLRKAASSRGDVVISAPDAEHSGSGHRVSEGAIRVHTLSAHEHAVQGTPADCARLGIMAFAPDVDWVLSGINHGGNLGNDVYMSGTVAAAREAAMYGRRAIAFSHYRDSSIGDFDWDKCHQWVERVLDELLPKAMKSGEYWNVNFPHLRAGAPVPQLIHCPVETKHFELGFQHAAGSYHYSGRYQDRGRTSGHDVDVCFSGNIAISKLHLG